MNVFTCIASELAATEPQLVVVPLLDRGDSLTKTSRGYIESALGYQFADMLATQGVTCSKGGPFYLVATGNTSVKGVLVVPGFCAQRMTAIEILTKINALAESAITFSQQRGFTRVALYCRELDIHAQALEGIVVSAYLASSRFSLKSGRKAESAEITMIVCVHKRNYKRFSRSSTERALAVARGCEKARELVLLPPNLKKPVAVAETILNQFSDLPNFSVTVYPRSGLEALQAGGILAVGDAGEPVLVRIAYTAPGLSSKKRKRVAIVGKGVTMDTGGYCIKPREGQVSMKGDCGGAAAVLGTMVALRDLCPAVDVIAYIPLVENLIDSNAMLTGDILTTLKGLTVEVLNTDAEGRLILADAISLACRENPSVLIDVATLTGAAVVALGGKYAALFSNCDGLASDLLKHAEASAERLHRLPLDEVYDSELESSIADLKNIGEGKAGTILAALFLQRFVDKGIKWAHLDIAGAGLEGIMSGTTKGFGVRTVVSYIMVQ